MPAALTSLATISWLAEASGIQYRNLGRTWADGFLNVPRLELELSVVTTPARHGAEIARSATTNDYVEELVDIPR